VSLSEMARKLILDEKKMTEYIPFVSTSSDLEILRKYYSQCEFVRIPYEKADKLVSDIPNSSIWLDPCVDGYHHRLVTKWPSGPKKGWQNYYRNLWNKLEDLFKQFPNYDFLADPKNWRNNRQADLDVFIERLLEECARFKPMWISVPQLPITKSKKRNNVNKMLAQATNRWKRRTNWNGKLILPVIFTNQSQLNTPATRRDRIEDIAVCFEFSGAKSIWIVDETLSDQQRNKKYPKRYNDLIDLHEKIKNRFDMGVIVIAGPYWGINLVLWAKGLCDNPAFSLSGSYSYNISCGVPGGTPVTRIVLPPLRRLVVMAKDELEEWLEDTLSRLSSEDRTYLEFKQIKENSLKLSNRKISLQQIAQFYSTWLQTIEALPKTGRKLALYQDLSSAYVVGSQLKKLPTKALSNASTEMQKPGKVAEQLMLKCLS